MQIISITDKYRIPVQEFIRSFWHADEMVSRGRKHTPWAHPGFICIHQGQIVGLITYQIFDCEMEITLLDSRIRNRGNGTNMLEKIIAEAQNQECNRVWCICTNDNLKAMGFYQKRGLDMVKLHYNAMETSRKLKPEIPLTGAGGLPIKHEIEFEMVL